jgi:hypothetical protein
MRRCNFLLQITFALYISTKCLQASGMPKPNLQHCAPFAKCNMQSCLGRHSFLALLRSLTAASTRPTRGWRRSPSLMRLTLPQWISFLSHSEHSPSSVVMRKPRGPRCNQADLGPCNSPFVVSWLLCNQYNETRKSDPLARLKTYVCKTHWPSQVQLLFCICSLSPFHLSFNKPSLGLV